MINQPGMTWEKDRWDELTPVWSSEPSLDVIKRLCEEQLGLPVNISFWAEGAFNRLYLVTPACSDKAYMLRVSLPVHPRLKTESEAATLGWLRRETSIPVPRVFATCSDSDNELGFEWMLMDRMPAIVLADAWADTTWEEKKSITKEIAACIAQLNALKFKGIGSLRVRNPEVAPNLPERQLEPGTMVSREMFWGNRTHQDTPRGPFNCSKYWLNARLDIYICDFKGRLEVAAGDPDEIEDPELAVEVSDERDGLDEAIILAETLQISIPCFSHRL